MRIGKEDPEGTSDGDGQYYHYLTKWMVALNRMSLAKGDPKYNKWAIQVSLLYKEIVAVVCFEWH